MDDVVFFTERVFFLFVLLGLLSGGGMGADCGEELEISKLKKN